MGLLSVAQQIQSLPIQDLNTRAMSIQLSRAIGYSITEFVEENRIMFPYERNVKDLIQSASKEMEQLMK